MYFLGYDCGTSSIKASLLDADTGTLIASAAAPETEMRILSEHPGWAEQNPHTWWEQLRTATAKLKARTNVDASDIAAIGVTYQMHGLVIVDRNHQPLRNSIIWCDSRAVEIGNRAFRDLTPETCLQKTLNSPGNFTASKLAWVRENEPDVYSRIHKAMLPGDYIALKLTGKIRTTPSGLSEMILWDFQRNRTANFLLEYFDIDPSLLPEIVPTFSMQGELTRKAADEPGLSAGTKLCYRAGDQPNNALSLNVLQPGEIAATAGTSGVVYGVSDALSYDGQSRVNSFIHVNHTPDQPRYGVLLCINGTGIQNSWLKNNIAFDMDYPEIDQLASGIPVGSEGVRIVPFGNGAERILSNRDVGGFITGMNFNKHDRGHLLRAGQEGIAFAMNYGLSIMKRMDVKVRKVRAGNANMFLSPVFCEAFSNTTQTVVELYNTDGSQGAARGAGIGSGMYENMQDAFRGLKRTACVEPDPKLTSLYKDAYTHWTHILQRRLEQTQ